MLYVPKTHLNLQLDVNMLPIYQKCVFKMLNCTKNYIFNFKSHLKLCVNHFNIIHNVLNRGFMLKFLNEAKSNSIALLFHNFNYIQPIDL